MTAEVKGTKEVEGLCADLTRLLCYYVWVNSG